MLQVTIEPAIAGSTLEQFRDLYRKAFDPLRTLSAARQVLTDDEFAEQMADPRVEKYVARDEGDPVGILTVTTQLEAVPWISPEYFRARFPEHAARDAIFYVPFTLADPERPQHRAIAAVTTTLSETLIKAGGVCCYDVCGHNRDVLRFADNVERFFKRQGPAEVSAIDSETYYAADFAAALQPPQPSATG